MKHLTFLIASFFVFQTTQAQFNILKKLEDKAKRKVDNKIDNGIDKGLNKTESEAADALKKDKDKDKKKPEENSTNDKPSETKSTGNTEESKTVAKPTEKNEPQENKDAPTTATYGKFDFVPGDKVIFDDDFATEENGEFPSKWKLIEGSAENIVFGNYKGMALTSKTAKVTPLLKEGSMLPKVFTLEFDVYFNNKGNEELNLNLGAKNHVYIEPGRVYFGAFKGASEAKDTKGWHHISMAVNERKMKIYFDEVRILNVPDIGEDLIKLENFSVYNYYAEKGEHILLKSVRLSEGGMDLYKRIMSDGKYIARGILFDPNKATLKPQSMGQINGIVKMMKEHPELKFTLEGHTDSDGDEKANQKLSEERVQVVKEEMIKMGIEKDKLSCKGFGESKPSSDNTTPEGKANNRRVEFVKN